MENFVDKIGAYVPTLLGAAIVLVVGVLAAWGLARLVRVLLSKLDVDRRLKEKTGASLELEGFLGGLVYYGALVYVLILTLGVLGIQGVLEPLNVMFSRFIGILPNIIAAVLVGALGYVLARICGNIVTALTTGLDKLSEKAKLPETFSASKLLGQLVFILVFVPILISALDVLKIQAIAEPATETLRTLMAAIPQILAAALILGVAFVVGKFVTDFLASFLASLGTDSLPEKIGVEKLFGKVPLSQVCAGVVFFFIMVAAAVTASQKLGFPELTSIVSSFLSFAGNVVLGLVILGVGTWIANFAHAALQNTSAKGIVADIARIGIMVLVLAMGLRAMGIAEDIVDLAFLLSLGAVAVAFALAFGLGGRQAAGKQVEYWFERLREPEEQSSEDAKAELKK